MNDLKANTFKINNKEYDIEITYWDAVNIYRKNFKIDLIALFENNSIDSLLQRMYLGDELALELMEHYIKEDVHWEEVLKILKPHHVKEFKDAWWSALMGFFDPLRSDFLKEIRKKAQKLIKEQLMSQLDQSTSSLSNSSESQE